MQLKCKDYCFFLFLCIFFSACGFRLRQGHFFPFHKLFVTGIDESNHVILTRIARVVASSESAMLVKTISDGDAVLDIDLSQKRDTLSLTKSGLPQEFIFITHLNYVLKTLPENTVINSGTISASRAMSYSDRYALAKEIEEALLSQSMIYEVIDRLFQRLSVSSLIKKA